MKTTLKLTTIILTMFASSIAFAADDHDHSKETPEEHHEHEENVTSGPNGGHVIASKAGFSFEVTVDKERKARVVFLDKDNNPVALESQTITGIAGERSAPTKLVFAKGSDANAFVSDKPLPAGAHIPMILMIKTAPDAKAVTERFELHLH
jgi:hypothetical protein